MHLTLASSGLDWVCTPEGAENRATELAIQSIDVEAVETPGVLNRVFALPCEIAHAAKNAAIGSLGNTDTIGVQRA